MHELLSGFLSNESSFGKLMTRLGVIIGANLMFVLFSMPIITTGAAYAALYHVMLKTLRGDGVVNPFVQFWKGFRGNFKQATITWVFALLLIGFGYVDLKICEQAGGMIALFRYPLYALGIILAVVLLYLYPTMAAFADTLPHLIRNGVYFALHKPWKVPIIAFFNIFPLYLTYTDPQMGPLYAFIWCFFGFGSIVLLGATLLLPDFKPYLPLVDACGDFILDEEDEKLWADSPAEEIAAASAGSAAGHEKTEAEMLEEMMKLGM